jgi:hypothetical protein
MKFVITPEEAQRPALAVMKYLRNRGMQVYAEKTAWADAPYRTTLVASKGALRVLVEAQRTLSYSRALKELVSWIGARRHYAQFYIATVNEAVLQAGVLAELRKDGVGLFIVDEADAVTEHEKARNPALLVTPDPTLRYGNYEAEVKAAVRKFNETNRKDGLRDMCELVERAVTELGVTACRRSRLKMPAETFQAKDLAGKINELARAEAYHSEYTPVVTPELKDDLHSFRTARNLVDHPAHGRRENARREMQFADRMAMGPRLLAQLVSLKRTVL